MYKNGGCRKRRDILSNFIKISIRVSKHNKPKSFPSVRLYGNKTSYAKLISKIIVNPHPRGFLETFGGTGVISVISYLFSVRLPTLTSLNFAVLG